jgi:hypothetical protein
MPCRREGTIYEKLTEKQRIVLHEALQPANIRPVERDDQNLPHVPSLALPMNSASLAHGHGK